MIELNKKYRHCEEERRYNKASDPCCKDCLPAAGRLR